MAEDNRNQQELWEEQWNVEVIDGDTKIIGAERIINDNATGNLYRIGDDQRRRADAVLWDAYFANRGYDSPPPEDIEAYGLTAPEFEQILCLHILIDLDATEAQRERAMSDFANTISLKDANPYIKDKLWRYALNEDPMIREKSLLEAAGDYSMVQPVRIGAEWVKWSRVIGGEPENATVMPSLLFLRQQVRWFRARTYHWMEYRLLHDLTDSYHALDITEADAESVFRNIIQPTLPAEYGYDLEHDSPEDLEGGGSGRYRRFVREYFDLSYSSSTPNKQSWGRVGKERRRRPKN